MGRQTALSDVPPAALQRVIEGHTVFAKELRDLGAYRDSERLRPTTEAKRVSVRDGRPVVVDGPFAETKEGVGGFYIYRAKDMSSAKAIAAKCPLTPNGFVSLHKVMSGESQAKKGDHPGKVFAFLVRGPEAVMDRIDRESTDEVFGDRLLGGVRLDGPFAERRRSLAASSSRALRTWRTPSVGPRTRRLRG